MVQQREARFINEWLNLNYPEDLWIRRAKVGPFPTKDMDRLYMTAMRWIDGVVIRADEVLLVEAKLRPSMNAIYQLRDYRKLFGETLRFKRYWHLPRRAIFLTTYEDPRIVAEAKRHNIEYVVFAPVWVKRYLLDRYGITL